MKDSVSFDDAVEFYDRTRGGLEQLTWSGLWGVDNETGARSVQPTIDRLLARPDPDRPRTRRRSHRVLVFARR